LRYENILFDLDGTLTDPFIGITKCIEYALLEIGRPVPEDLRWCIGPPLHTSFKTLLGDEVSAEDDLVKHAMTLYRKRYAEKGINELTVYDGIVDLLDSLNGSGFSVFLATSKPRVYAQEILKNKKLDTYFKTIYGSELDGTRTDKTELIKYIIDSENLAKNSTVMIGDRKFDLIGAAENQIDSIAITWGYGSQEEFSHENPAHIISSVTELLDCLQS